MRKLATLLSIIALVALPTAAQFGGLKNKIDQMKGKKAEVDSKTQKEQDLAKKTAEANKDWTPEEEEQVGENTAARLIHTFGIYDDEELARYVNLVGGTVARQGARTDVQYHFAVLDTDSVNAMALPGGFIFVTKGALKAMTDESQLAGVLGHEVAHVDGRHLEKELKKKGTVGAATQYAGSKAKEATAKTGLFADLLNSFVDAAVAQVATLPYSKGDESDADKKGLDLAAKAGYDPNGLRTFLEKLAPLTQNQNTTKYLSAWQQTHPPYEQRVAALDELLKKYTANGNFLTDRYKLAVSGPPAPPPTPVKSASKAPAGAPAKAKSPAAAKPKAAAPTNGAAKPKAGSN